MSEEPTTVPSALTRENYEAWHAMMDFQLAEFFGEVDIPVTDRYSRRGLEIAEGEFLQRFSDVETALEPQNQQVTDRFMRYLGQTFVKSFDGRWDFVEGEGMPPYVGVAVPIYANYYRVLQLTLAALKHRRCHYWADLYGYAENRFAKRGIRNN